MNTAMNTNIISLISLSALGFLTSCTFVDTPAPSTRTTTTAEVTPTTYGSVKTTTTRNY